MDMNVENYSMPYGDFITLNGERYYKIGNIQDLQPFFISLISAHDHWLFASSTGGLTAGRVSPETALFPYVTVDKIHDSPNHTGSKTLLRVNDNGNSQEWEPFNIEQDGLYHIDRNLYKNGLSNKLCFEEINHDLQLIFRYSWMTSDRYGFIRKSELENLGNKSINIDLIDGLQNILPAGTPRFIQSNSSNLVDAYKWTELDKDSGLAMYTLYSGITDRAEPCESLKANTVFCLGLEGSNILLSSTQLEAFRLGKSFNSEIHNRGVRGAYLVNRNLELIPKAKISWQLVANIEQTQAEVVALRQQLKNRNALAQAIADSIEKGSDKLARIMASSDGFQLTAQENVSSHHYANVVFNILRGGIFNDQYTIDKRDFSASVQHFNQEVYQHNQHFFDELPESLSFFELTQQVKALEDFSLERLCCEYLPITFGRRHGDPSRPWNQFAIQLKDDDGNPLLTYQGNWRDIFQNWEALCLSYPEFIESIIAKFVNASTMDGYNPYRITKQGIDWEVEDPEDPWSYIGYWGDHQIIYLLKLLELSHRFHPGKLAQLLRHPIFSYANVPYRIKPFESLLDDAKNTVLYDHASAQAIEQQVAHLGADGKLVLDSNGKVYQVNLLEKLMVPMLSKLGNLVIAGGIWMNTQRPEWNDANNALVGQGLSMVTLYYLRRYIDFMVDLLEPEDDAVIMTREVTVWISETASALDEAVNLFNDQSELAKVRYQVLTAMGQAASRYRMTAYNQHNKTTVVVYPLTQIKKLLEDALTLVDYSIGLNRRKDGLYHAYNLLDYDQHKVEIKHLYPMLEGQVAVLSSGTLTPQQSVSVIKSLFESDVYRADQNSFMLYPDRALPGFLQKNVIPVEQVESEPLLQQMLAKNDDAILLKDEDGIYRFNANLTSASVLSEQLDKMKTHYGNDLKNAREPLLKLYESVFNHQAFTGRSGGMFGFEGLGCIYWHMVSKLLLAAQESFFNALGQQADSATLQALGDYYYRIREGIGFNKTPEEYGAFPMDPYSHTPKHAGAQQPGMTGQVKEEIITRFGELGIRVCQGEIMFQPALLRALEFLDKTLPFRYLDVDQVWKEISLPPRALAFTWCQVPFVYQLSETSETGLTVSWKDKNPQNFDQMILPSSISTELFRRSGEIQQVSVMLNPNELFVETDLERH